MAREEQRSEAQRVSQALADAAMEAEERQADETVPGGVYMVNGVKVNANGEAVKKSETAEREG